MMTCECCGYLLRGRKGRKYCTECAKRLDWVGRANIDKLKKGFCSLCHKEKLPCCMTVDIDETPYCLNCFARIVTPQTDPTSRSWSNKQKIDILKSAKRCAWCGEQYPDVLLFVDEGLETVAIWADMSRKEIVNRAKGTTVFCRNCLAIARRGRKG